MKILRLLLLVALLSASCAAVFAAVEKQSLDGRCPSPAPPPSASVTARP